MGDLVVKAPTPDGWTNLRLKDVLYAPRMHCTLVSLGRFDVAGYKMTMSNGYLTISMGDKLVTRIPKLDGLYRVTHSEQANATTSSRISLFELHQRFGHTSYGYLKRQIKDDPLIRAMVDPSKMEETECDSCLRAKATRAPIAHARSSERATSFGDMFHLDVWGPSQTQTINHCNYTLTMVDDYSLWLEEPLLKTKDESFPKYVAYEARLQTQHGIKVKVLHSDRGGEFLSNDFTTHLERQGTLRQLTVHDTPEHNGVAERTHRTVFNAVRACMLAAGLPKWLWGEAHQYAVYVFNRTPHSSIGFKTPYEKRYGTPPDMSTIRPWGAICYVQKVSADKLASRAEECCYLGPDPTSNGVRVYWPKRKTISVERNVVFSQREIPLVEGEQDDFNLSLPRVDERIPSVTKDIPSTPLEPQVPEELTEPVHPDVVSGKRARKPSRKVREMMEDHAHCVIGDDLDDERFEANLAFAATDLLHKDPLTQREAMSRPDADKWVAA